MDNIKKKKKVKEIVGQGYLVGDHGNESGVIGADLSSAGHPAARKRDQDPK